MPSSKRRVSCHGFWLVPVMLTSLLSPTALAQRAGQSVSVLYGVVTSAELVDLRSNAVPGGALVGGAIGLYTGKGKSSGSKFRRAATGAVVGGATASAVQGSRDAREYQVRTATGVVVIISDQTQIDVDDCVVIETPSSGNSNIRRVAPTFCEPESSEVVAQMQEELIEEAEECRSAKQELAGAETDEAVDRALRKISILCDT